MVQLFNLLVLSALLLLLANGILSDASGSRNVPLSGSKSPTEPITYDIPDELGVHHESLREFKAVSSHGRTHDDEFEIHIPAKYSQLQVLLRASYLLLVFSPVFSTSGLAYISSIYRNLVWYGLLKFAISHSGAAFIKWAQWASTRPDIFPEDLCSVLESLQAGAPVHSFSYTKRLISKELGAPIEKVFESFDSKPLASGSIAQVYKARLNGRDVAVKVRHPNVEEQIGIDFIIMRAVASVVDMLPGLDGLKLGETMSQFSHTIGSQTRLDIEGRHLYLFNKHFRWWDGVSFPEPIVLTESVLIESYELGETVAHYSEELSKALTLAKRKGKGKGGSEEALATTLKRADLAHFIVTTGEDTYLKMLLQDNLMHADLHPGNILIQPKAIQMKSIAHPVDRHPAHHKHRHSSGSEGHPVRPSDLRDSKGVIDPLSRIVLVDAGMVAHLLPEERENFIGLIEAMGEGRGEEAADYVMQFTAKPQYDALTRANFRRDMKELFSRVCRGYGHNVDLGETLRGVLHAVRVNKIAVDANYATLVMNCLCLDSIARSLMPSYNILDGAKPLLRFHRVLKRIPGSRAILKAALPVARMAKRISDWRFLQKLKGDLRRHDKETHQSTVV